MIFLYFLLLMIPIVVIHELGHYWAGRRAGIAAEVFSVGFGPKIWAKTDKRGTKWQFAAIPLGGYVKFAPDMNGTQFPGVDPAQPHYQASFLGKIITILAGPFANFLMSFLLFFIFASLEGPPGQSTIIESTFYQQGDAIEKGERILEVEGVRVESYSDFLLATQDMPAQLSALIATENGQDNRSIPNPHLAVIGAVIPGEAADDAGLEAGDQIIGYGEAEFALAAEAVKAVQSGAIETRDIRILRNGEEMRLAITPQLSRDDVPIIGIYFANLYETQAEALTMGESVRYAWRATNWVLIESWNGLRDIVTGQISVKALSGPVGISRVAEDAAERGFWDFVFVMAMISSAIGFMNLLPIPILDGGHVILLSYERIFGRMPPIFVTNALFALGIVILLGVLMITTTNDLFG